MQEKKFIKEQTKTYTIHIDFDATWQSCGVIQKEFLALIAFAQGMENISCGINTHRNCFATVYNLLQASKGSSPSHHDECIHVQLDQLQKGWGLSIDFVCVEVDEHALDGFEKILDPLEKAVLEELKSNLDIDQEELQSVLTERLAIKEAEKYWATPWQKGNEFKQKQIKLVHKFHPADVHYFIDDQLTTVQKLRQAFETEKQFSLKAFHHSSYTITDNLFMIGGGIGLRSLTAKIMRGQQIAENKFQKLAAVLFLYGCGANMRNLYLECEENFKILCAELKNDFADNSRLCEYLSSQVSKGWMPKDHNSSDMCRIA